MAVLFFSTEGFENPPRALCVYSWCAAAAQPVLSRPFFSGSLLNTTAQMFSRALYSKGQDYTGMCIHLHTLRHKNTLSSFSQKESHIEEEEWRFDVTFMHFHVYLCD